MEKSINGIHHITVMAGDPQKNYDFYTNVLGLRLVKKTINFDAPDIYHLYYGDETGNPGTILTFFPFPNSRRGKRGTGEINSVAFSVPTDSLDYWMNRFADKAIDFDGPNTRFNEKYISILDPDGMKIEIVTDETANKMSGWDNGDVVKEHSIRKFFGATFLLSSAKETEELLTNNMGFRIKDNSETIKRLETGSEDSLARIDLVADSNSRWASSGAGSVHHIAWRTANDDEQLNWRQKLINAGMNVTEVLDRNYFHSIYYREPGGILFEIATDPPGFMVDETKEELGANLKLPEWYEPRRKQIESGLIPLVTKSSVSTN
jgi:glyoxalase family protein